MASLTDFLTGIADAIRAKKGTSAPIPAADFAAEIASIEGGGTAPVLSSLEVTENGVYTPAEGVDGFETVTVNVDAGGDVPVLSPLEITENGTYEPPDGVDGFNSVTVNVEQGTAEEPVLSPLEVSQNGVYVPGDGVDGFSQITVNVQQQNPELEYIEPTAAQYIKTGIYPSSETKIEIKVRRDAFSDQALFGSRGSSSSSDRFVSFMSSATKAHCQFYNKSYDVTVSNMTGKDVIVTLSKNGYYYDDTLITAVPETAFTSSYELYIFGMNQANSLNRPISNIRFYYCKIWQNDVLVRDFVPVYVGGVVVCLYDKVNEKYYTGADFIAGPVKS